MSEQKTETKADNGKRQRVLRILGLAVGAVALVAAGYQVTVGRYHVTTDNAYVGGNQVQLTPLIGGTVLSIAADDTDFVKAGQVLVGLDPADAKVALEQAEAELATTVREVRTLFATTDALRSDVASRQAELARVKSDLARAEEEFERRRGLAKSGAVSAEELSNAQSAVRALEAQIAGAESAITAAREKLTANEAQIENTTVATHPSVQRAAARVHEAYLGLSRAQVLAPVSGYVAKRSVQVGQRVQPGAPLLALVPLSELWVDANFKEAQLRKVRIGQPVTLTADFYGDSVEYQGKVVGLGAGTGGAFALIPAQNATGNWIKVVQRVPVRIALDPKQLKEHPLRIGLSMEVDIDVHDQNGPQLASAPRQTPAYVTDVYADASAKADAITTEIIASNAGVPVKAVSAR